MKKVFLLMLACSLVAGGFLVLNSNSTAKAGGVYKGTVLVAGMGGHFTKAAVTIDPSADTPIKVDSIDRIVIGDKTTHPTHDPRVDVNDKNIMFWSTYKLDPSGKLHVGKSNIKTGEKIEDKAVDLDARATWKGALYCGSGQTKKLYMPVTMTDEAYIDVFDKKTLELKHRVFLDKEGYGPGKTKFYHGINSPDMKTFALAVNLADEGKPNGKIDMLLLDMKSLEKGKVKVIAKNTLTGEPGKTLTFRQTFTRDGKHLLQAAGDRMYVLDGKTLAVVDEEMVDAGEDHDVISTPDGKYALLSLRTKVKEGDKDVTDGTMQLYDMTAKKVTGGVTSMCISCHKNMGIVGNATLCGADAVW
jgi:hypothetical protein